MRVLGIDHRQSGRWQIAVFCSEDGVSAIHVEHDVGAPAFVELNVFANEGMGAITADCA